MKLASFPSNTKKTAYSSHTSGIASLSDVQISPGPSGTRFFNNMDEAILGILGVPDHQVVPETALVLSHDSPLLVNMNINGLSYTINIT